MGGSKKLILLSFIFFANFAFALPNPAAVYCKSLGYNYSILKSPAGESGQCIFSATEKCDEWSFLAGTCGQNYSYCVKHGYGIKTVSGFKNSYLPAYAVCVPKISGQKEINVTDTILIKSDLVVPVTTTKTSTSTVSTTSTPSASMTSNASLPSSFSWIDINGVDWTTPVKDQGDCGSCWDFAAVGGIEAKIKIENNSPFINPDLSEEDVLSCAGIGSCDGGQPSSVLIYTGNTGIVDEACFPYTATQQSCSNRCSNWNSRLTKIAGASWLPNSYSYNIDKIKQYLVNKGPIVALMHMSGAMWDSNGIFGCGGLSGGSLDHGVVIVGYNDTGGFWVIRNSWGNISCGSIGSPYCNGIPEPIYIRGNFLLYYGECSLVPVGYLYVNASHIPQLSNITDLSITGLSANSASLAWTGMDDTQTYVLAYSTTPLTESNFNTAPQVSISAYGVGGAFSTTINGLYPHTTYYFAVKAYGGIYPPSNISNIVSGMTPAGDLPTFLNWSVSPLGAVIAPVTPQFICGYYNYSNNASITGATVNFTINSTVYAAVYNSSAGDYEYSGVTLTAPGEYSWGCNASASGYQTQYCAAGYWVYQLIRTHLLQVTASPASPQYYGTTVNFSAQYVDINSHPILGANVTLYIDGIPYSASDIGNGWYSYLTNTLTVGTHLWNLTASKFTYQTQPAILTYIYVVNVAPNSDYMLVRGMDNSVYFRVGNGTGWGQWNTLPGSTIDSPAATMLGNQLHIVVRGTDGSSLWYGYLTNPSDPKTFSGWTLLSGSTPSAPTLTSNGTALCLVVRGGDNRTYYRIYNSTTWGNWNVISSGTTLDSPAAAMLGNQLHIVVRGTDGSSLWYGYLNMSTNTFSGWMTLSGSTQSKPALTYTADKLYLAVTGLNGNVYWRTYNVTSKSWADWNVLPLGATPKGPAATIFQGALQILVQGMDGSSIWWGYVNLSNNRFSGWASINGATPSAPTSTSTPLEVPSGNMEQVVISIILVIGLGIGYFIMKDIMVASAPRKKRK